MLDARYLVPNARKMDSLGMIGKYKYYRTLRREIECVRVSEECKGLGVRSEG